MKRDDLIIVRGGGDLATGTIHRLWAAGLRVLVLEIENPAAIRRQVALCEAVYTKTTEVEGLRAVRIDRYEEAEVVWQENSVPILIDPKGIVRWEGFPFLQGHELTAEVIEKIMKKYK